MWITMRRSFGQRQWRRGAEGSDPAAYAVLTKAGAVLAEIAHVELRDGHDGVRGESPSNTARLILARMVNRGRLRRSCDPGRVSRFPLSVSAPPGPPLVVDRMDQGPL